MELRARKTISSRSNRSSQAAFTLVEILIVLGIISMVMSIGLPAIQRVTYQKVNSTTRKLVGVMRSIRNDAILLNTVHRIAFDMDRRLWWVEKQKSFQLLSDQDSAQPVKKQKGSKEVVEIGPTGNFQYAEKYNTKPQKWPDGVSIGGVLTETEGFRGEGLAYIHFFPNGFNDKAIVYITREGAKREEGYCLYLRPTGGHIEAMNRYLKDFDSIQ